MRELGICWLGHVDLPIWPLSVDGEVSHIYVGIKDLYIYGDAFNILFTDCIDNNIMKTLSGDNSQTSSVTTAGAVNTLARTDRSVHRCQQRLEMNTCCLPVSLSHPSASLCVCIYVPTQVHWGPWSSPSTYREKEISRLEFIYENCFEWLNDWEKDIINDMHLYHRLFNCCRKVFPASSQQAEIEGNFCRQRMVNGRLD